MATGYTQYTLASLIAEISGLLDDPTYIQWKYPEIRYGILEALRYWGALTSYWRAKGTFSTVAAQPWYDLSAQLPLLRPRIVSFNDIVTEINYHCFELPGGTSGAGLSSQFSITSIILACVRALNRFRMDAGLPLVIYQQPVGAAPAGTLFTVEDDIYLRHAYWKDIPSGAWSPLRPTDAWAQDAYNPLWTLEPAIPFAFSQSATRPLEIQLFPPPVNDGVIEWLAAQSESNLTQTLGIPDEFAHAVKYAALADLFTMDGETFDPQRGGYCDQRYRQTVDIARYHRSVARVQIDGVPAGLSTITMLDSAYPRWRMTSGKPSQAGCDLDILAFSKVPDAVYGIGCDVLQSAPIPATDTDFIQIGREQIPIIVDYVQHYLGFKLGGVEFFANMPLYDGFMAAAKERNAVQAKQIRFLGPLYGMPQRENSMQMPGAGTATAEETVTAGAQA